MPEYVFYLYVLQWIPHENHTVFFIQQECMINGINWNLRIFLSKDLGCIYIYRTIQTTIFDRQVGIFQL